MNYPKQASHPLKKCPLTLGIARPVPKEALGGGDRLGQDSVGPVTEGTLGL